MSFSSASQEEMFPGALQKKIYPINTHYITCIIMGLLIEGPPFFKGFPTIFPMKRKCSLVSNKYGRLRIIWCTAGTHRAVHGNLNTNNFQHHRTVCFLGGSVCLSVKTSSSTNLFQSSTPVFVCKKKMCIYIYIYICTRVAKVSNFTHPTEILGNTSQQLDGHAIGFPRPRDVGVRIGVS